MEIGWDLTSGIAVAAAIVAIIISVYTWFRTQKIASYADIDLLYQQFLTLGTEHPRFRDPSFTSDYNNKFQEDELVAFSTFAFISWNICETIYDRCRAVKELWHTWEPIIVAENKLHRRWFDTLENFHKFKKEFREFVQASYPREYLAEERRDHNSAVPIVNHHIGSSS